MPDIAAPRDSRANVLYADEHAPLTLREAWRVLVKSWPFVSRYRRLRRDQVRAGFRLADVFPDDAVAAENRHR